MSLITKDEILKAFNFRHACKLFDDTKDISDEDLLFILETGRLSPSSFGLEHWKFIVVRSRDLKEKLKEVCYGQVQLTSCSAVVVIVAKVDELTPGREYVKRLLSRFALPPDSMARLDGFYPVYCNQIDVKQWSIAQCHIAAANMMTAAACIGIDSCPIGAFEPDKVTNLLGIDSNKQDIALIIPFGYRKNPQGTKNRLPFDEVVEFRKA